LLFKSFIIIALSVAMMDATSHFTETNIMDKIINNNFICVLLHEKKVRFKFERRKKKKKRIF